MGGTLRQRVSIAFRRSAPWLLVLTSVLSGAETARLHCLSAFCPLATPIVRGEGSASIKVSIAFRRSAPWLHVIRMKILQIYTKVSIAFRRSAPWLLRLPNHLAGRGCGAIQVTTADASRFSSCWPLSFCGVKLPKVLGFGKLKFRSGPRWFSWLSGRDLERCGSGRGRGKIRDPKTELRRKSEARNLKGTSRPPFGFLISDFGLPSVFGFRVSDFPSGLGSVTQRRTPLSVSAARVRYRIHDPIHPRFRKPPEAHKLRPGG